jgi:hypothetical protein
MSETIYSIPINEAFDKNDGCPLCRLRAKLESDSIDYISGAALMEPDVRIETNKLGFCRRHFDSLLGTKNRLGLALIMQTRLDSVQAVVDSPAEGGRSLFGGKKSSAQDALIGAADSCFVCRRVDGFMEKVVSNVIHLWKTDAAFREKFTSQKTVCLPHASALAECAESALSREKYAAMRGDIARVCSGELSRLREAIGGFVASYDHRNAGVPLTDEQRNAVEDAGNFLSGENFC